MRIVTPLFWFGFNADKEFAFSSRPYRIVKFGSAHRDVASSVELFSRQDVEWMKDAQWALTADVDDVHAYSQDVNLLLMAFKIYRGPDIFVKYHLCEKEVHFCRRLNDTVMDLVPREDAAPPLNVTEGDLVQIDTAFTKLLDMERVSDRTHNALYFLFRGLCAQKMIDIFVYLMMVLESLFSEDKGGGATWAVCSRTSALLNNQKDCTRADIKGLYDLRSRIIHGRVITGDDIKGQKSQLSKLQYVVCECMKRLLDNDLYKKYGDDSQKKLWFQTLKAAKG